MKKRSTHVREEENEGLMRDGCDEHVDVGARRMGLLALGASQTPVAHRKPPSTAPTSMWSQHAHAALAGPCKTRKYLVILGVICPVVRDGL